MCVRYCIEAVDRTLRAIMSELAIVFVGKWVHIIGDRRQILPVVPKASRVIIVNMCLKSSTIFSQLRILQLTDKI